MGNLYEDLSKCIFLTTVLNIFYLNNSVNETLSCISMETLNGFILLTATCSFTIQMEHIVTFLWQQWVHECGTMLRYM
jgi:hypothetical protein